MFKNSTQVESLQQVVAMLVAVSLVVWSVGYSSSASAANLIEISNTLTDSDISATSDHSIVFTVPPDGSGVATSGGTMVVEFPTTPDSFDLTGLDFNNVSVRIGAGTLDPTAAAPSGATWGAVFSGGDTLTLTSGSVGVATNTEVEIAITNVGNPATGASYEFVVTAGADTGRTRVVILDNVLVTASVPTIFEFTVTGVATGTSINGTSTTGSTTATEIPFGDLFAGEIKTLGQRLDVTTNARNGYVVTVEQDQDLQSLTGAIIDSFIDGNYNNSPTAWVDPSNDLLDNTTWGHWGLTTTDGNLQGAGVAFTGTNQWIAASTTPRVIMAHNSSANATGTITAADDDVGQTFVAYQVEITPLQEAADDYTTTLTYIATPTF